jgi:hypothetical protein
VNAGSSIDREVIGATDIGERAVEMREALANPTALSTGASAPP